MAKYPDRLLIVDTDKSIRDYFSIVGEKADFEVSSASDVLEMKQCMSRLAPTVILLGLQGPVSDATDKLRALNEIQSGAKIILLCDMDLSKTQTVTHVGEIMGLKMSGIIQKPMAFSAIHEELKRLSTAVLECSSATDCVN